ncbi:MAG: glycosyltransferase family 39 protein, partial [Lachnoclostridium sp.]|nr:glycosyltransferase family 39 protein [Lachnoclostridium sp.]
MTQTDILLIIIFSAICLLSFVKFVPKFLSSLKLVSIIDKATTNFVKKYYIPLTIAAFSIGVFIRVYKCGEIPYGFNQDEAMAALDGLTLSEYATDHYGVFLPVHLTAWIRGQMSSLLSYSMIPFLKLFGPSEFTARLPLLIFSLLSLWVVYRFSCKTFGKFAAIAILFVYAVNPWQIMMSRWALDCNLYPLFMLFGAYFLCLGLEKKKYLYFSMIMFGLTMYCYGIAYYTTPMFLIIMCIILLVKKAIKIKQVLISFAIYFMLSLPILMMMLINLFKWETIHLPFMTISLFENTTRTNDILFFSPDIIAQLKLNVIAIMNTVFSLIPEAPWNAVNEVGSVYYFALPLFVTGLILLVLKKKMRNNMGVCIILVMLLSAVWSGIITNNTFVNRLNTIFIP